MIPDKFEFSWVERFQIYYETLGFRYTETPWVVSDAALNLTKPLNVESQTSNLVASGEQSFLQLLLDYQLPAGRWQTITPCFREFDGNNKDGLHFSQFYKLELIIVNEMFGLEELIDNVVKNLDNYGLRSNIVQTQDEPRACKTVSSYDIEIETTKGAVEFGSYGLRYDPNIGYWIYGTGLALPRFQFIMKNHLPKING